MSDAYSKKDHPGDLILDECDKLALISPDPSSPLLGIRSIVEDLFELSNWKRLIVLLMLARNERVSAHEIHNMLELNTKEGENYYESDTARHLARLRKKGFVIFRRDRANYYYYLVPEARAYFLNMFQALTKCFELQAPTGPTAYQI